MLPFSELVQRWASISQVPIYVGSVPEGTLTPYASLNVLQSNPVRLSSNTIAYTESLMHLVIVADKLVDAQALGQQGLDAFDKFANAKILDCVYMNQAFEYSDRPGLSGNRPWSSIQEFRFRN